MFRYQQDIIKKIGVEHPVITSEYDFYTYYNNIILGSYQELEHKGTTITVDDNAIVNSLDDFAREIVWYGRNRRAPDYTSTNYKITIS